MGPRLQVVNLRQAVLESNKGSFMLQKKYVTIVNPRTALNGPTVGSHFLRVEAIIGLPSICRPRGVGPGGRRGAKERITI